MKGKYLLAALLGSVITSVSFLTVYESVRQTQTIAQSQFPDEKNVSLLDTESIRPHPEKAVITSVDNSPLEIENKKLRSTVKELERKIADNEKLRQAQIQSRARIEKFNNLRETLETKTAENTWSDSEVEEVYQKPFSDYVKSTQGIYRDQLHEFQFEPINEEWALNLETKIKDFIQLNEFSYLVEISLLNCKTYRCELGLLVLDPEKKPWKRIFDQMTLEPWFQFYTHYSAPIVNESYRIIGNYFFMEGIPPKT